jgi:transposase-like protein
MPAERVPMRQVREILRLTFSGDVAGREIARRLGIAPSTVRAAVERFRSSGLSWPLGDDITDEELEERLYGIAGSKQGHRRHAEPDFSWIHRELKRKHVTLSILWEEYIEQSPDGYRYSRYVAAKFMLRERPHLAGSLRAGRSLTQHNPMPGVADLVSTEVRHGSEHFSQS